MDRVLLKCHAGCDIDDILAALGLTRGDLFDEPKQHNTERGEWTPCGHGIAREYPYVDEQGKLLFTVVRCPQKDFAQWRPDPASKSGRRWKLGDVRRVLYRLPQIIEAVKQAKPVWVVEGEKDADRLTSAGVAATCNPHGAGKWRDEYAATLAGATVTIIADRDEQGRNHAATIAASLRNADCTVRIVEAASGKDVSEHLDAGHTLDDLGPLGDEPIRRPTLELITVRELRARVAAAGPRRWLLRGIWPGGAYGIHAGEMKAQKTWNGVDLAVAVASKTPWLGHVQVDDPGTVIIFAGEGGEANLLRRIDAVAQGLAVDDMPIHICTRVPHLSDDEHLGILADQLDRLRPRLVVLDPLYLAARGAKGSDLYAMGELLETVQHLCTAADSSLWIATHLNRKEGRGAGRITGAGPAEWGRVLITATIISRHTEPTSKETTVITELDIIGGEVADRTLRVIRRIRATEPDNLDSPLIYQVDTAEGGDLGEGPERNMPPARAKLLAALRAIADGVPRTWRQLTDQVHHTHGHYLTRETCSRELGILADDGYADRLDQGKGKSTLWTYITQPDDPVHDPNGQIGV